jgi:hypothetical protein
MAGVEIAMFKILNLLREPVAFCDAVVAQVLSWLGQPGSRKCASMLSFSERYIAATVC